jgi:hypothetical protein
MVVRTEAQSCDKTVYYHGQRSAHVSFVHYHGVSFVYYHGHRSALVSFVYYHGLCSALVGLQAARNSHSHSHSRAEYHWRISVLNPPTVVSGHPSDNFGKSFSRSCSLEWCFFCGKINYRRVS